MEKYKISFWIEVHRRTKWRMARRIVTLPEKRWNRKIFDWHPGLDTNIRLGRQVGRPKRRWEDDLNEFTKTEEGDERNKKDLMNNNGWMIEIKNYEKWEENEEKFSKFWYKHPLDRRAKPNLSVFTQTVPSSLVVKTDGRSHWCAATHGRDRVLGNGRLLAAYGAHPADYRYELPQTHRRAPEEHARFIINRLNMTILMRQIVNAHTMDENMRIFSRIKRNPKEYTDDVKVHYMMTTVDEYTVHRPKDFIGKKLMITMKERLILDDEIEEKNFERILFSFDKYALAFSHFYMCLKKYKHVKRKNTIVMTLARILKMLEVAKLNSMNQAG